jgi:hypothetical protein
MPSSPKFSSRRETYRTLVRFLSRLFILAFFATFNTQGFGKALVALLAFATIYCAFVAVMRREATFGPALGHMDEAVGYTLVGFTLLRFA